MITLKVTEFKFFARCEHVEDFLPADAFAQEQVELGEAKEMMTKAKKEKRFQILEIHQPLWPPDSKMQI